MLRILVVDDQHIERAGLRFLIREFNLPLEVYEGENGLKALEVLERVSIDILLTDVRMPLMDGIELIRQARLRFPSLKIVIVSAYDEFAYAQQAMAYQVYYYLLKPVDNDKFLECIQGVCEQCRIEREQREEQDRLKVLLAVQTQSAESKAWSADESGSRKIVADVLEHIHEHYAEEIWVESVADAFFLSADYLNALFKGQTGVSLMKYIIGYRMDRAKDMLRSTHRRIADIAGSVGYADVSYFCKIYKKHTGLSPSQYRERSGRHL